MLIYFALSVFITIAFLKLYIDKLSKTNLFRRKENIAANKKPCIQELHKHKAATPTMGGLAINLSVLLVTLAYFVVTNKFLWLNILLLLFGLMGFVDDFIKIKKLRDGVKPSEKLIGLTLISILIVVFLALPTYIYAAFAVFLIVASSNSLNITDGLDGLAAGICAIAFAFIGVCAYRAGAEDVLFGAVIFEGACLGFLFYNKYPARVFMGDTGSLILGGAIAVFLIRLDLAVWIIFVLPVCFFESLSVIIQLTSLKFFKKRVFHIAPFHHHLEKCGWKETKIVFAFWGITLVCCLMGGFLL